MILMNKAFRLAVLVLTVATLTGCAARVADLTMVSTRSVDLSNAQIDVRSGTRAKGSDCTFALLGLIPFGLPNPETAVDEALKNGGGNFMVDQVMYRRGYYYVIGSSLCIDVEGTVLNVY